MAIPSTYTPIATYTLPTAQSSYTFSSIPTTYTDLVLVASVNASTAADQMMRFNGDTTSLYSATVLSGNGSATSSYRQSNDKILLDYNGTPPTAANTFNTNIINIQNYANTTTFKTSINRNSTTGSGIEACVGTWRSTAAINSITFLLSTGNLSAGTTLSLYGIANNTAGAKATGGVISSDSNYFYHTFYSTGTFTPSATLSATILTLAGGGGGGSAGGAGGGGGGAGGYVYTSSTSLTSATAYTCTVGAGGTGASAYTANPTTSNGVNSNITGGSLSLTAAVGGGGGGNYTTTYAIGVTGGSGGGGSSYRSDTAAAAAGGAGTSGQGFAGGNGFQGTFNCGGGGGGAGAVGQIGQSTIGGAGGIGINTYSNLYSGINGYIAGGGGGACSENGAGGGVGGLGGGGNGQKRPTIDATHGLPGSGGGGGGFAAAGTSQVPGNGGSGVIVIRYAR